MEGWGPDTPWRQGQILSTDSVTKLRLSGDENAEEIVVLIITHDCDLSHHDLSMEPDCEIIIGKTIEPNKVPGQYTEAKHPRRLLLSFTGGSVKIWGDFVATQKRLIKKADLVPPHKPCETVLLTGDELSTLQRWLSARYYRATFPNEFNKRLAPLKDKIGKIIDKTDGNVTGIYFSLDKNSDKERNGEDDVYELQIFLLRNSEKNPDEAARSIGRSRAELFDLFRGAFRKDGVWKNIELRDVHPTSDQEMSLRQSWRLREWKP